MRSDQSDETRDAGPEEGAEGGAAAPPAGGNLGDDARGETAISPVSTLVSPHHLSMGAIAQHLDSDTEGELERQVGHTLTLEAVSVFVVNDAKDLLQWCVAT